MPKYDARDFIKAYTQKVEKEKPPACRFCNCTKFSTTDQCATILLGEEPGSQNGKSVPAGMLVCKNCGHIEFFALGALGLLNNKGDEQKNGDR